jgi:hypothetical protein
LAAWSVLSLPMDAAKPLAKTRRPQSHFGNVP